MKNLRSEIEETIKNFKHGHYAIEDQTGVVHVNQLFLDALESLFKERITLFFGQQKQIAHSLGDKRAVAGLDSLQRELLKDE